MSFRTQVIRNGQRFIQVYSHFIDQNVAVKVIPVKCQPYTAGFTPKISITELLCANGIAMLAAAQLVWVFIHNLAQDLLRTGITG